MKLKHGTKCTLWLWGGNVKIVIQTLQQSKKYNNNDHNAQHSHDNNMIRDVKV
jgi:Zn-finger nucleic acid-binding protein